MTKNQKGLIIGIHAIALAGIATGYICMYKKLKKPELNLDGLCSFE